MAQFISPRPLQLTLRKPRNPLVVPTQMRQAGRHQSGPSRQSGRREVQQELQRLERERYRP